LRKYLGIVDSRKFYLAIFNSVFLNIRKMKNEMEKQMGHIVFGNLLINFLHLLLFLYFIDYSAMEYVCYEHPK
jgi:hypothetical protein